MKEQLTREHLLTDEQIDKAEKKLRETLQLMIDGKVAINQRDYTQNKGKQFLYFGSVSLRNTLRLIEDLRYYKKLAEEVTTK